MKPAMRLFNVIGFVNVNLFDSWFHVEIFIEDVWAEGESVTNVCARIAVEGGLSFRDSIHPLSEMQLRVAMGMVPHAFVKGGIHG
uniref:Uncharacterized protein n=1 Tax=Romanomermis culicivorax TaxID=13658 RepID=A0A915IPE7_ROMCU